MLSARVAVCAALLIASPLATAQEPIDTITVEAAKLPAELTDMSSKVTLIDYQRIDEELAQNIADLVRYEPGIDVVEQGSRFGLAGISIRGVDGNRVKIEVDGVPTADAFSIGSFSNASRDFVDIDSLKQVEIVRGPASAVFGSDALGGVVSFVTMGPHDLLGENGQHFDFSTGYNSVDSSTQLRASAAFAGDRLAALFRVTGRQGSERDVTVADPVEDESLNLFARLDVGDPAAGGVSVTIESFIADTETQVDSREGTQDFSEAFGFPYVLSTTEVGGDDRRERQRVGVGQEWLEGRFGTDYLRWRAYWQDSTTTQDTFEARDSFIAGIPASVVRDRTFEFNQELSGIEVNAASDLVFLGASHQIAYGLEYERTDTDQIRTGVETDVVTGAQSNQVGPDLFPVRDFPLSKTERIGIYLQDRIEIGQLAILPGLRWDRYQLDPRPDDIFAEDNPSISPVTFDDSQVSPKLGVTWDVLDSVQLYAQYSEGFRAPPVNDVNVGFTNLQFGYTTLPNPNLESESSRGYELGVRVEIPTLSFDVSSFLTRYDDFIESFQVVGFDPITQLLQFQSINVDAVQIVGGEVSGAYTPQFLPNGMRVRFSAAYAEGENRNSGQYLNSIAPFNGVLGLEYDAPSQKWGASVLARGSSRQEKLDRSDGPRLQPAGYVILDAYGYWRPTQTTRIRAGVYNLTDRDYLDYLDVQGVAADSDLANRFQRPGSAVSVAFDWTF